MKKLLLATFLLFAVFSAKAQMNILFPDSNAQWAVYEWDGFGNPAGYVNYYMTNADTVINSQNYNQLFVFNQSTWFCPPTGYHAAIRKDIVAQKVFIVPEDSITEYLLYDFSAAIGDTIYNLYSERDYIAPSLSNVYVTNIDSVLHNTTWLKRMWIQHVNEGGTEWIEMSGAARGPLAGEGGWSVSSSGYLSCMSYNDTLYPQYGVGDCFTIMGMEKPVEETVISVSPNPSNGIFRLTINSAINEPADVKIYNALGEIVLSRSINTTILELDITVLQNGVYFISLESKTGIYREKIIKH
jgi:hypothetical protein